MTITLSLRLALTNNETSRQLNQTCGNAYQNSQLLQMKLWIGNAPSREQRYYCGALYAQDCMIAQQLKPPTEEDHLPSSVCQCPLHSNELAKDYRIILEKKKGSKRIHSLNRTRKLKRKIYQKGAKFNSKLPNRFVQKAYI